MKHLSSNEKKSARLTVDLLRMVIDHKLPREDAVLALRTALDAVAQKDKDHSITELGQTKLA